MPQVVITDTKGLIQQAGSGIQVNNALALENGSALTTGQTTSVQFSNDSGVVMQTGVSGSALDFPLTITGSATTATACGIHLFGTSSNLGTDVGIGHTVAAGSVVIFFDSTINKLKIKFANTIQTITSV